MGCQIERDIRVFLKALEPLNPRPGESFAIEFVGEDGLSCFIRGNEALILAFHQSISCQTSAALRPIGVGEEVLVKLQGKRYPGRDDHSEGFPVG